MTEKKYQVFVSSTYDDLKEERKQILSMLLMADCIPSGMEAFVATDNEQFEVIKKVIDLCDYYVLVIGKRYGSVSSLTGKSYTEMEYDYAKSRGIPILVFAIDSSVTLPEEKTEIDDVKKELLIDFRAKALDSRLASIWKTSAELFSYLVISIMNAKSEFPRPGWQRATDYDEASLRREISILTKDNLQLQKELLEASETITTFTKQDNLAFENHKIKIKYHWKDKDSFISNLEHFGEKTVELKEIFNVIALEMLEDSLQEQSIERIIKKQIIGSDIVYYLDDPQMIKRLIIQFNSLGLIKSQSDAKTDDVRWGLTEKGKKFRDDALLIRKKQL